MKCKLLGELLVAFTLAVCICTGMFGTMAYFLRIVLLQNGVLHASDAAMGLDLQSGASANSVPLTAADNDACLFESEEGALQSNTFSGVNFDWVTRRLSEQSSDSEQWALALVPAEGQPAAVLTNGRQTLQLKAETKAGLPASLCPYDPLALLQVAPLVVLTDGVPDEVLNDYTRVSNTRFIVQSLIPLQTSDFLIGEEGQRELAESLAQLGEKAVILEYRKNGDYVHYQAGDYPTVTFVYAE